MRTFQQGKTILIKPTSDNASTFCNSPVAITKALKESSFRKIIPKDVRLNRRRNLLAIDLHDSDLNQMQNLLKTTQFGKYQVSCSQPLSECMVSGVIGPVETDISEAELTELIKCKNTEVLRVTRLNKFKNTLSGKKEPSLTIKIDFSGNILPNSVP